MRRPAQLRELLLVFGRMGVMGFGGPAAHIALMRDEVVVRRRWLDERRFLDLVAVSNLFPGPTSTELAGHIGFARGGIPGLAVAWSAFILPGALIVAGLAALYVRYGTTPVADALVWGLRPVVIVVVAHALVGMARTATSSIVTGVVAMACAAAYIAGVNELLLLAAGGAAVVIARRGSTGSALAFAAVVTPATAVAGVELWRLGAVMLKIGALLYGSGYVIVAFLRNDLVRTLGWLTERQLFDAVAAGQVTPGPLFSTATFVGYVLAGWAGAVVATAAIFAPSFIFVALSGPLVPRLSGTTARAALDGLGAAAVGLMAGVVVLLTPAAFPDGWSVLVAAAAAVLLFWRRVPSVWLLCAGAAAGLVRWALA